jgi:hypothetical protein
MRPISIALTAAAMWAVTPALAQSDQPSPNRGFAQSDQPNPGHCFFSSDFDNWKADGDKTIYIRLKTHRVMRLDLAGHCPLLTWPGAVLRSKFRGSESICHPIDWDIQVSDSPLGPAHACIVNQMTELPSADPTIPKIWQR